MTVSSTNESSETPLLMFCSQNPKCQKPTETIYAGTRHQDYARVMKDHYFGGVSMGGKMMTLA